MWLTFEDSSIQFTSWELSQCLRIPWRICLDELTWEKTIFRLSINQPVMYYSIKLGFGCNFQDTKEKGHCKTSSFASCNFTFLFLNPSFETQEAFSTEWKIHLSHSRKIPAYKEMAGSLKSGSQNKLQSLPQTALDGLCPAQRQWFTCSCNPACELHNKSSRKLFFSLCFLWSEAGFCW